MERYYWRSKELKGFWHNAVVGVSGGGKVWTRWPPGYKPESIDYLLLTQMYHSISATTTFVIGYNMGSIPKCYCIRTSHYFRTFNRKYHDVNSLKSLLSKDMTVVGKGGSRYYSFQLFGTYMTWIYECANISTMLVSGWWNFTITKNDGMFFYLEYV